MANVWRTTFYAISAVNKQKAETNNSEGQRSSAPLLVLVTRPEGGGWWILSREYRDERVVMETRDV